MRIQFFLLFGLLLIFSNVINAKCIAIKHKKVKSETPKNEFGYRFADANEAASLILSNRNYFENMNQKDLDYRLQKVNATLEEYEQFVKKQLLDYTDKEKKAIENVINDIKKKCYDQGYTLPPVNNIVFIKTTMLEEEDKHIYGYSHGTQIYLGEYFLKFTIEENEYNYLSIIVAHELFHCLTRNNPEFRKAMYNIIGFTVLDQDIDFPKETTDRFLSNPDVEHHDTYVTFNINGEKKECAVILSIFKDFEKVGDNFANAFIGLVPLDDLYTIYDFNDFYEENENYDELNEPEEMMAYYFSYLMYYDINEAKEYISPSIVESIDSYLKSNKY